MPVAWTRWPDRRKAAFAWGAILGVGFGTHLHTPAFYAFVGLAAIPGRPVIALLIGGSYGLARGVSVGLAAVGKSHMYDMITLRLRGRMLIFLTPLLIVGLSIAAFTPGVHP